MRGGNVRTKEGDTRIRRRFLLLPLMIGDEQRWLESVRWEERAELHPDWAVSPHPPMKLVWVKTRFLP